MTKYNNSLITLLLFFLSFSIIISQENFEGQVKFNISSDGDEMLLNYFIKGDDIRMEIGDNSEAVYLKSAGKSIILMPEEKMYMNLDNSIFSKLPGMSEMNDDNDADKNEDIDFEKFRTGKTKTILGYECDQWVFNDEEEEEEVEAWVTNELGNFMFMESPMGGGFSPGWSSSIKNNGFFPLLVVTKDDDGDESSRFEAIEVNKKNLNDDLFIAPSNFNEMKIPGM